MSIFSVWKMNKGIFFMKRVARSIHECFAQQTKLLILAFPRSLANLLYKSRQVIEMFCLGCWVLFFMQDVALRAYAHKSWLNIMALSWAITGREVIGFTNQPWLLVCSGTRVYGSYFRLVGSLSDRGLGGNEKLALESKELRSEDKLEGKDTLIEWNLYAFSGIAEENQTEMLVFFFLCLP